MEAEVDADGVLDETYDMSDSYATTLDDQLTHLKNRGISVSMPKHIKNQHSYQRPVIMDEFLQKGQQQQQQQQQKQHHQQQQQHIQPDLFDQQQAQQQHVQLQVQFPALQSNDSKTKTTKTKSSKTVSNKNNGNNKRRKQSTSSSIESLCESSNNGTQPSHANQFALLSELDITFVSNKTIAENSHPARIQRTESNTCSNVTNISSNPNGPTTLHNSTQAKFCPPIILYNIDIGKLALELKNKFPNIEVKFVNCSRFRSKLYIKGIQAYNAVMKILKEKKIGSHSFTPIENKQISLIIRGLHYNSSPDEIKNELDAIVPNVVSEVRTFETPHMKKNNISSDLFCVTLLPGKAFNEVSSIKYLLFQKIFWEKPKASAREVQCKRCQRWGHLAKNCNHAFQCVKCDKIHEPGQCSLIKEENSQPYCVNCKKWGHPANFRGCEAHLALLKQKKLKMNQNMTPNHDRSFITPKKSFASLFNSKDSNTSPNTPKSHNSKLINEFLIVARQLLDTEPISIETRIQNFLHNFKSLSADDRKAECLKILRELENFNG